MQNRPPPEFPNNYKKINLQLYWDKEDFDIIYGLIPSGYRSLKYVFQRKKSRNQIVISFKMN